jgi:DNA-binding Xre family transcriptional regulator
VKHRHLVYPRSTPVERWPVAALVDVLERGDLADWKPIAVAVARDPHGTLAERIMEVVDRHPMYGTSPLWRAWIDRRRAGVEATRPARAPIDLADLRRRMGLTQVQMARRVGISQSDLSKLERRKDIRLSTLDAYTRALGGRLRLLFAAGAASADLRVGGGNAPRQRRRR